MSDAAQPLPAVPQLRLGFRRFDQLAPPRPVPGYALRAFRPGDEDAWVALLATGTFGEWDRARLDRMLAGERAPLPLAGAFFAAHAGRPVGTACTFLYQGAEGEYSELGWVAVLPEHRGRGLGRWVCQAVLAFARERGHRYIFLKTEDFRLPAIRLYLSLGFEPEMVDPSHPAWWQALRARLGEG